MKAGFLGLCLMFLAVNFGSSSEAQTVKIRVAVPGYTIAIAPFLTAKLNGYYADEGLEVELIAMRAPTANLAVLAGNVPFSTVPLVGLTTAVRGAPLKLIFCPFDKPQHVLFAKPEIQNIKALRGKKIAVSGPGVIDDIVLREILSTNGFDSAHELTILTIGSAETRLAALTTGAVDAAVLIAPASFKAKESGFKELISFSDQNFLLPSGGIVVRDDLLRSDPAMVETFVRATLMGFWFLRDNRPSALKALSRSLKVDEPLAAKIYDAARPTMTQDGSLSEDAQRRMIAVVLKLSSLKEAPAPEKLFDFSLLKKAQVTLQQRGWKPAL